MSVYKYDQSVYFDGNTFTQEVTTANWIPDATLGIWTLYDLNGNELIGAVSILNAQTVQLSVSPVLPEGNYQLVGIA
jgi:hypothetical protein